MTAAPAAGLWIFKAWAQTAAGDSATSALLFRSLMKQSRALRGRNLARDSQVEGTPLACVAPGQQPGATFFASRGNCHVAEGEGNAACAGLRLDGPDGAVDDECEGA